MAVEEVPLTAADLEELGPEILKASADELQNRRRLLENDIKVCSIS
jgi:hypothetical protein